MVPYESCFLALNLHAFLFYAILSRLRLFISFFRHHYLFHHSKYCTDAIGMAAIDAENVNLILAIIDLLDVFVLLYLIGLLLLIDH